MEFQNCKFNVREQVIGENITINKNVNINITNQHQLEEAYRGLPETKKEEIQQEVQQAGENVTDHDKENRGKKIGSILLECGCSIANSITAAALFDMAKMMT